MKRESLTATLVLVVLAAAPIAFAQNAKPKKKGAKPAASASATATETAPPADTTPPASPTPSAAPEEAPSASASAELPNTPPEGAWDNSNTEEEKNTKYYFVGLRYRGNIVPQFLESLFVDDGSTIYSNYIGIELDMRQEGHSTIPWIAYANYSFGDTLFLEKGKDATQPQNYSDVKSGLSAIYLGLDELWSAPLDEKHHWDFEYGFGVGIGVVFGTLNNDWVYQDDPNGLLAASNGHHYTPCPGPGTSLPVPVTSQPGGNPCDPVNHQNSHDTKTGNYAEKNWFNGGSVPTLFPYIAFPDIGVRWKPIKQFESRLHLGFSLTGFWFGISGSYGLEKPPEGGETKETPKKSGYVPGARGML